MTVSGLIIRGRIMSINSNSFIRGIGDNGISAFDLSRLRINNEIERYCVKHNVNDDLKAYLKQSLFIPESSTNFSEDVEKAVLAYIKLYADTVITNVNTFLGNYDQVNAYSILDHDFLNSGDSACSKGIMEYATISVLSRVADPDQEDSNSSPSYKKSLNSADTVRPFELKIENEIFTVLIKGVFCESITGSSPSGFESAAVDVLNDETAAETIADAIESFVINSDLNDNAAMNELLGINGRDGRKCMVFITDFDSLTSGDVPLDASAMLQTAILMIAKYLEEFSLDEMVGRSAIGKEVPAGPLSLSAVILNPAIAEMCQSNFRRDLIDRLRKFGKSTQNVHVFDFPDELAPENY